MKKVFLTIPNLAHQQLNGEQIRVVLQRGGVILNGQEIVTLFRALDPQKSGKLKLTKILRFVVDNTVEIH